MEEISEFNYGKMFNRVVLPKIGFAISLPILILVIFGTSLIIFNSNRSITDEEAFGLIVFLVSMLFVIENSSKTLNAYPKIRISDEGLNLRMFFFRSRWLFIPWTDIVEITSSKKTFQHYGLWEISIQNDIQNLPKFFRLNIEKETGTTILISSDLNRKTAFIHSLCEHINCEAILE